MKKSFLILTAVLIGIFSSGMANALPTLQLDILGGYYVGEPDATTYSSSQVFTLRALSQSTGTFYVSAALVPQTTEPGGNYGSFDFAGNTIDVTGEMTYGTAPIELAVALQGWDDGDLSQHGIFETYFSQFEFTFDEAHTVAAYNVADSSENTNGSLYYQDFLVDVTGLDDGYHIHFDLYNTEMETFIEHLQKGETVELTDIDRDDFAPFSHDAQSNGDPVPEPATMVLLGSGLLGLAGFRKKNK